MQSHQVLYQTKNVFPFELFPDTITVDRVKVTITLRYFFATAQVVGVAIEDILNVAASVGPFFGSIKIWTNVFAEKPMNDNKPLEINHLPRNDALELEHILQGLIIANRKNVDTSTMTQEGLLHQLKQLGQNN